MYIYGFLKCLISKDKRCQNIFVTSESEKEDKSRKIEKKSESYDS